MESELVLLLKKVQEDLKRKKSSYIVENGEITKLEHVETKEDKKRRKELAELFNIVNDILEDVKSDLLYVTDLEDEIEELKEEYEKIADKKTRRAQRKAEKIELKEEKYAELKKELEAKYKTSIKHEEKAEEKLEKEETTKKVSKKSKLSPIAILAAIIIASPSLAILTSHMLKNKNNSNNKGISPAPSSTSIEEYNEEIEPVTEEPIKLYEENGELFVDIFDEEQVALRAEEEVLPYYNELVPNLGLTNKDAEELLKWMNNGNPEKVGEDESMKIISEFYTLMSNESNYAIGEINNSEHTIRNEQNVIVDYGKFFIDNSKAQELATRISEYRSDMILNREKSKESAIEFTNLLMKSWYLDGCDGEEISLNNLDSASHRVFIEELFLDTATLAMAYENLYGSVNVINPIGGEIKNIQEIIMELNKANCPAQMKDENGKYFNTYVNKNTADITGMLAELTYNKENIKTRSLTK